MALIERDGKVFARKLEIFLGPNEWGNDLMRQVAREAFATDASLDAVQVNEHAGWHLTFLRDGTVVGTANDQAHLMTKPQSSSTVSTATTRRERFVVPDISGRGRRFHLCEFTSQLRMPLRRFRYREHRPRRNRRRTARHRHQRAISGRSRRIRPTADSLK